MKNTQTFKQLGSCLANLPQGIVPVSDSSERRLSAETLRANVGMEQCTGGAATPAYHVTSSKLSLNVRLHFLVGPGLLLVLRPLIILPLFRFLSKYLKESVVYFEPACWSGFALSFPESYAITQLTWPPSRSRPCCPLHCCCG